MEDDQNSCALETNKILGKKKEREKIYFPLKVTLHHGLQVKLMQSEFLLRTLTTLH